MKNLFLAIFIFILFVLPALLIAEQETGPLVLDKLEWFQDQKFGLFVHWAFVVQGG